MARTTAILSGSDPAAAVVEYARTHNFSNSSSAAPADSHGPGARLAQRVGELAPDVDLIEIGRGARATERRGATPAWSRDRSAPPTKRLRYVWALLACFATTLVAHAAAAYFDLANIVMLFLLTVVLIAVKWGRGPAVLAAFVSVAASISSSCRRGSHLPSDVQYLLTFVVMLTVALDHRADDRGAALSGADRLYREERARALYEFARDMSSLLQTEEVVEAATKIHRGHLPGQGGDSAARRPRPICAPRSARVRAQRSTGAAQWAFDRSQPAGAGTDTLPGSEFLYLPLRAPMRTRGVLAISLNRRLLLVPEQRRHLDTFAALIAIALERVHYVEVAQQALIRMESERLRNSLLSALSHDLRTPLAALVGLAESLELTKPELSGLQRDTARAIAEEARRMNELVNNLLDMARIESGDVKLRREWQSVEEVVGSALKARSRRSPASGRRDAAPRPAARRVRRDADRARALQPAGERGQVHAAGNIIP